MFSKSGEEKKFAVVNSLQIGLVESHGYTAEEHKLTTWDGYILVLHRITGSPLNPRAPGKPVVFLQHGLLMSSDAFVLIGPAKDLAFLLADAGYDVWLGNARGNTYSRSHVFLSPKQKKFSEFSYHEIGVIDLSTSIDYVLRRTGQRQLIYIGFSMGTTEAFALLSTLPRYNQKISLVICLTPIVFWRHKLHNTMQLIVNLMKAAKDFSNRFGYYEVLPQSSFMGKMGKSLCSDKTRRRQLMNKRTSFFEDHAVLLNHLPNVVLFEKIPYGNFNHLDILWSKDSNGLLYDSVMSLMHGYSYQNLHTP